ncbi:MAG: hypothetical protein U0W24_10080 [Bacteroidales bacterium]
METKSYQTVKELIKDINRQGDKIAMLFGHRTSRVVRDDLLGLSDNDYEQYDQLLQTGFIRGDEQTGFYLDDRLIEFLEKFLEIEEDIHPEYLEIFFKNIKQNINYYQTERNPRARESYFYQIQRDLRSTGRTAIRHTAKLNQKVQLVFETESNTELKQKKLEDIREKRNQIEQLIKKVEHLIENELFFRGAESGRLEETIISLRADLSNAMKYLIEVQQHIIEYINKTKYLSDVFEKLQVLKRLKDRHELRQKSSINHVLENMNDICINQTKQKSLWLNTENFELEEYREAVAKVNQRLKRQSHLQLLKAPELEDGYFDNENEESAMIKLNELKMAFVAQNSDLFSFIVSHPLPGQWEDKFVDINHRAGLFCKIASLFEDDFLFSEETKEFMNFEYAVIMPR